MMILSALVVMVVVGLFVKSGAVWGSGMDFAGDALVFFGGFFLVVAAIMLPLNHLGIKAEIQEYESVRQTAAMAREGGETWELAAYQQKVAEMNQWRAGIQYWNGTIFDIWVPDEVEDLEPIR